MASGLVVVDVDDAGAGTLVGATSAMARRTIFACSVSIRLAGLPPRVWPLVMLWRSRYATAARRAWYQRACPALSVGLVPIGFRAQRFCVPDLEDRGQIGRRDAR
ncbi:MAG: hypothetical protein FWF43_05200 [Propionibacteriaceae bacterium]|nr:hypothetical protein [Propionibacteriaceae bacterium]